MEDVAIFLRFTETGSAQMQNGKEQMNNSWRNDPVTEKQKQLILDMWEDAWRNGALIPEFGGKTKGEASDYISRWLGACCYSAYSPHEDAGDRI